MPGFKPTPGRSNRPIKTIAFLVACIAIAAAVYIGHTDNGNRGRDLLMAEDVIEGRQQYHKQYSHPVALIQAYEERAHILSIENPSSRSLVVENPAPFFSIDRIEETLALHPRLSDREKMARIFNFVASHRRHTYPLYETAEMHHPVYYFNVYSSGFCDDVSHALAQLASHYGFQSKIAWMPGHVVASIFHGDAWRVYDADLPASPGILTVNGEVATLEDMAAMAHQGGILPRFNEAYRNVLALTEVTQRWETPAPILRMQPCERKFFFDDIYMLSSDGNYLEEFHSKDDYLGAYSGVIANFVGEIPLACQDRINDEIRIDAYFPLSGLFLRLPKVDRGVLRAEYPSIDLDSDMLITSTASRAIPESRNMRMPIDDRFIFQETDTHLYLDLSVFLKTLEYRPSHQIRISGIRALAARGGATLLAVHNYSRMNADFSEATLAALRSKSLIVAAQSPPAPDAASRLRNGTD